MNNYAITSDGIATALQDSASALMEGGNSLEEAVALVAAANRVVQDPNSVGAALRTISLRLRGTSVEILEEMGEETDGVVESTSKLQEKLKALTGVDILTDAGDYKDTYTILKEIGQEWENLSDIDKAATLELMAGKNRANTLSAILSNMKDLEGAYESAMGANGSAIAENEKYLDSIEGKIAQFKASTQTMWMHFLKDEVVKFIVDVGTHLIKLVDTVGLFPTALAGVFAYIKLIKNHGLSNLFDSFTTSFKNTKAELMAIGQIKTFADIGTGALNPAQLNACALSVQNLTAAQQASTLAAAGLTQEQIKQVLAINGVTDANIEQVMSEQNIAAAKTKSTIITGASAAALANEGKIKLSDAAISWLASQNEEKLTYEKVQAAIASGALTAAQGNEIISTLGLTAANHSLGASFKAVAAGIKAAMFSNPFTAIFTVATTLLTVVPIISTAFDRLGNKTEETIQKAEELTNEYNTAANEIAGNLQTLNGLEGEFEQLSKGVDDYGNNISLTADEYERYKEVVSTILGLSPSLIQGYDAEGNAIANKNGLLQQSIDLMKEEQRIKAQELVGDDDNYLKLGQGAIAEIKEYQKKHSLPYGDTLINFASAFAAAATEYAVGQGKYEGQIYDALHPDDRDLDDFWTEGYWAEYGDNSTNFAIDFYEQIVEDLRSSESILKNYFTEGQINGLLDIASEYDVTMKLYNDEMSRLSKGFNSTLQVVPQSLTSYYKLDDQMKGFLSQYINTFEITADTTDEELEKMKADIEAFTDWLANNKGAQELVQRGALIKMGQDEKGNSLSVAEYQKQIKNLIKEINGSDYTDVQKNAIFKMLGLDAESNEFDGETKKAIDHVKNLLNDEYDSMVDGMSISDALYIYYKISADPNSMTFEELQRKVKETKIGEWNFDAEIIEGGSTNKAINAMRENLAAYREALDSLNGGTFTMEDYFDLIAKYPDLADGVDTASKSFKGLDRNLNRALKNEPDELLDSLKDLRTEFLEVGRSTDELDDMIDIVEGISADAVKNLSDEYITLADQINEAKNAQVELQEAMSENPNEGFETRGGAIEQMKTLMERGSIGSESELWSIAEAFGFTYDSAKTINENADALYEFIKAREKWYETDDDGNYTYEGTEKAINAIEKAAQSEEFKRILTSQGYEGVEFKWNYEDGKLDFDFDNADWDKIVAALAATDEAAGLTSEEFYDLLMQVGQFFDVDWENNDDILDYLHMIAEGTDEPIEKLEKYKKAMQDAFGENTTIDLANRPIVSGSTMLGAGWEGFEDDYATVYSGTYANTDGTVAISATPILPDGKVLTPDQLEKYACDIAEGADPATYTFEIDGVTYTGEDIVLGKFEGGDAIEQADEYGQALHEAQQEYDSLRDPLEIETTIAKEGLEGLNEIADLQGTISTNAEGVTVVDTDAFSTVLKEAGYTEAEINNLIEKIKEYENVVSVTNNDPLGLNNTDASLDSVIASLDYFGIKVNEIKTDLESGDPISVDIDATSLITELQEKGWTREQIVAYLQTLSSEENGLGITINGQVNMTTDAIDDAIDKAEEVPETENITLSVDDEQLTNVENRLDELDGKIVNTYVNTVETKTKKTIETKVVQTQTGATGGSGGFRDARNYAKDLYINGTAHAQGTSGDWGAPETTEALVGELGPELRVRGNEWTLIGQNGAEFTDVRRGDIIFNHKQTEDLLKNGYVTGRGKAYAMGTAFASGSGQRNAYTFSDTEGKVYLYDGKYKTAAGEITNAASKLSKAAEDVSDASDEFNEIFDWIEVRLEEINENIDLKSAKLENAVGSKKQNTIVDELIALNYKLYDNLTAGAAKYHEFAKKLLAKVPAEYREAAQDGSIAIESFVGEASEETLNAIQEYRDWVQKGADATQQAEETLTEISSLAKQAIDNIAADYENKVSLRDSKVSQYEAYNALLETDVGYESEKIYQAMMKETDDNIKTLKEQRDKMLAELNKRVEAGEIKKYSQDWYDAVNDIAAVDTEIIELKTDTEDWQDAINELHWDKLDDLMSRLEAVSDEAENLIDILGNKDVVDEAGNWTKEGITSLGLYAQQMEVAEMQAEKYKEEINYLNKNWEKLGYTEQEYIEKLEELKSNQYDAIKAYNDTKDAIVDLNSERVEAIKEGIQREIDAYEELIEKKKEELDAEKDLYDFQKNVKDQQKDIADIERQLAALSADNSASARAKRAQLEAELAEANATLEDTYYDRSISNQQEALDKELEHFQEEKDKEMEGWDKYLENTELVVSDSLATVQANTDVVYQTLKQMGSEYGLSITESLTSPWKEGEYAIQSYTEKFKLAMSATVEELKALATEFEAAIAEIEQNGTTSVNTVNQSATNYQAATKQATTKQTTSSGSSGTSGSSNSDSSDNSVGESYPYGKASSTSGNIQQGAQGKSVKAIQYALNQLGYGNSGTKNVDGIFGSGTTKAVKAFQKAMGISVDGIVGTKTRQKFKAKGYAVGTTGVDEDQWALIDELGEELVLHAQNGRLAFLTKGSAVIPHDISENIMELGQLDPSTILERNKPQIGLPAEIHNTEIHIDNSVAELIHIDNCSTETLPDVKKIVNEALERHTKNLNNSLKKYVR